MLKIMQGDQYSIPIRIKAADGTIIEPSIVSSVEIMVGFIKKTYPGEITFSDDDRWLFPLTQEESVKISSFKQPVQARIKFNGGDVVGGKYIPKLQITESRSKVIL